MSSILSVGIQIDSTDAVRARQDMEALASTGAKVDTALAKVEQGSGRTGKSLATLGAYAKQASESSSQMVAQLQQLNTTQSRQEALLKAIGSSLGGTTAAYRASASAVQSGAQAHKAYVDQLDQTIAKQKAMGISAGQTAAAMRQVPAQFTDIVTSLQGGQSPLTVLLQQGGQLKDSFGGVGAAASALGGYVAGLINPFTVGAAAVGLVAYAAHQGAEEMNAYSKALILTGGVSGKTAGELEALAIRIAATSGTQGQVTEALTAAVGSGKIASSALESVGAASASMSRVLGVSIDDAVGQFAKLADEPAKASVELNKQYHYLSASTYERIQSLEEQGRKEEAAGLAQKTYADASVARLRQVREEAGILSRTLGGLGDIASGMWKTLAGAASSIGARVCHLLGRAAVLLQEREHALCLGQARPTRLRRAADEWGALDRGKAHARVPGAERQHAREDDRRARRARCRQ
jgi:phage-related minor tail protein